MGLYDNGFGMSFGLFGIMFTVVFLLIAGLIVFQIFHGVNTWHKNNNSPRLTVNAKVVSKRIEVSHHNHRNAGDITGVHGHSYTSSTWYYVTFQVDSGDRMEFSVTGSQYGLLVEGDYGQLSFQGTRYLSFERF